MTPETSKKYFLKLADDADRHERNATSEKKAEYFRGLASGLRLAAGLVDINAEDSE